MVYNTGNLSTNYNIPDYLINVNSAAQGWLGFFILLAWFMICLLALKNYESKRAFTSASFLTLMISVLMNFIGLVQIYFTVVLLVMTMGGMLMLYTEDG